jgi:DNA polymerase
MSTARKKRPKTMPKRPQTTAAPLVPDEPTIPTLQSAAGNCQACDLWKRGTQTVFGEGGPNARVMLVGEQPGDQEDIQGRPFVGPAGKILNKALEEAGIDRKEVYVTNAVKHFKWEPRGKRRIHKKPNSLEIAACKPWIEAEIDVIHPQVIVCLGATAAQALLGRQFKVTTQRGVWIESPLAPFVMATVHPSSLLRAPDEETRRRETQLFITDLKHVHEVLEKHKAA